jgi:hypothetical protein
VAAGANGDIDAIEAHFGGGASELGALEELQVFRENSNFEIARGDGAEGPDAEAREQRGAAREGGWHGIGDNGYRIAPLFSIFLGAGGSSAQTGCFRGEKRCVGRRLGPAYKK